VEYAEWANYFSDRQASSTWFASVFSRGFNRVFSRVDTYFCAVNVWNLSANSDNINRPNMTVIRVDLYITRN
jgi:hypothetical protein